MQPSAKHSHKTLGHRKDLSMDRDSLGALSPKHADLSVQLQQQMMAGWPAAKTEVHQAINTQLPDIIKSPGAQVLAQLQCEVGWRGALVPQCLHTVPATFGSMPGHYLAQSHQLCLKRLPCTARTMHQRMLHAQKSCHCMSMQIPLDDVFQNPDACAGQVSDRSLCWCKIAGFCITCT